MLRASGDATATIVKEMYKTITPKMREGLAVRRHIIDRRAGARERTGGASECLADWIKCQPARTREFRHERSTIDPRHRVARG